MYFVIAGVTLLYYSSPVPIAKPKALPPVHNTTFQRDSFQDAYDELIMLHKTFGSLGCTL